MKKVLFATILLIAAGSAQPADEKPSFEKISDHCYVLHIGENGENIAAVVTKQGTLLFDPPPEPDLSVLVEPLKNLAGGPVRWMVRTGFSYIQTAGEGYFARQGAVLLAGFSQESPRESVPAPSPDPVAAPEENVYDDPNSITVASPGPVESGSISPDILDKETPAFPRFVFKRRMYLYPEDLEVQIQELQHEARTKADIVAYVPDEKVLFVGRLFESSHYPDIDVAAGGSALKWIDALEQVIRSVPLLISAIPAEEPAEGEGSGEKGKEIKTGEAAKVEGGEILKEEEEEKTLEEMITVISARGEVGNLQMMKDMLDTSKKLRSGISRAVKAGQSCERYLDSPAAEPYRIYGNFYPYGTQLCGELSPGKG
jgi:hypothetical protein